MKNRDLIIKSARRLDKFTLDDLIMVSELSEQKVKDILTNLLKQQVILKNGNTYFFNNKKKITLNNQASIESKDSPNQIIIEEQEGYDYFLTLNPEVQARIRSYVELINIVQQVGKNNLRQVIELYNQNSNHKKIVYSTFSRTLRNFNQYGFKGILPKYHNFSESPVPEELHTCFKKYYLTKEKLSATEALYKEWSDTYKKWRIKHYDGGQILTRKNYLRDSIDSVLSSDKLIIGTAKEYAAIHNFGLKKTINKQNKKGTTYTQDMNMPKREFMRFSQQTIEELMEDLKAEAERRLEELINNK